MDEAKKQVVDRLKSANNVLVTVSKDPSVDQLSACIGLSLALNKLGKHATAVYSGETPSTIEFLKPEETIEKNTDSLRDFIISLDKAKADKLRYKVEDQVVRIFITPYKTSITDQDLEFSQGDFNVDVVLAIGVHNQEDLDQAITAHGRILHDATVVTVNNVGGGELGSINWVDPSTSSLAEMASSITTALDKTVLDEQISTALLTGIVAETDRFSNEKTSATTMKVSAALMSAGANQQLVAAELQQPPEVPQHIQQDDPAAQSETTADEAPKSEQSEESGSASDGTLEIDHQSNDDQVSPLAEEQPSADDSEKPVAPANPLAPPPAIETPEPPTEYDDPAAQQPKVAANSDAYKNPRQAVQAPDTAAPAFTSAVFPNSDEKIPAAQSIDLPPVAPPQNEDSQPKTYERETLQDIERQVRSPHLAVTPPAPEPKPVAPSSAPLTHAPEELNLEDLQRPTGLDENENAKPGLDAARDAVAEAMAAATDTQPPKPVAALNAQQFGGSLRETPPIVQPVATSTEEPEEAMTMPVPTAFPTPDTPTTPKPADPNAAPSAPPPIMPPPFGQ